MKKAFQYIEVYLLLLLILVVGLWLFLLTREVFIGMMGTYYVGESFSRGYQAGFYERIVTLLLGLGWLVLFITAEELLRRQVKKGRFLKVFARFMGVLCLLAFAADSLMLIFLSNAATVGWLRWLILAAELIFGVLFVFLGWSSRSPWREKRKPGVLEEPSMIPSNSDEITGH